MNSRCRASDEGCETSGRRQRLWTATVAARCAEQYSQHATYRCVRVCTVQTMHVLKCMRRVGKGVCARAKRKREWRPQASRCSEKRLESRRLGALDHGALDLEEATEGRCGGEGGLTM